MGMTIVEKILARAAGSGHVQPGDIITVPVDCALMRIGFRNPNLTEPTRQPLKSKSPCIFKALANYMHRSEIIRNPAWPVTKTGGWGFEALHSCQRTHPLATLSPSPHSRGDDLLYCSQAEPTRWPTAEGLANGRQSSIAIQFGSASSPCPSVAVHGHVRGPCGR
jgi:hypothetical protein